jgi:hypothetical protein
MPFRKSKLVGRLADFFAKRSEGVSIETQRYLAGQLFDFIPGKKPGPHPATTLAGLCRAAEVVPAWWRKTALAKLDLSGIGTSDEATRLLKLGGG